MSNVLIVADIYIETQYFVDDIPAAKQFAFSSDAVTSAGSKMINAARVFTKLQDSVSMFGHVGDDQLGKVALHDLAGFNIGTQLVTVMTGSRTGQITVITNSAGESGITLYPGANASISVEDIAQLAAVLSEHNLIYAATNLAPDRLYRLVEISTTNNIPLFLDFPNRHKEIELAKISDATFVMPNRQETELILDVKVDTIEAAKQAILQLRSSLKNNILITLDEDGCLLLEKDKTEPVHFPTEKVAVVDATASGDIFRAVFASDYVQGKNLEQSIARALRIATKSVLTQGVDKTLKSITV